MRVRSGNRNTTAAKLENFLNNIFGDYNPPFTMTVPSSITSHIVLQMLLRGNVRNFCFLQKIKTRARARFHKQFS